MPNFRFSSNQIQLEPPVPTVGFKFIFEMWLGGITLIRALADKDIDHFFRFLAGAEAIYEFGGESDYYKIRVPKNQRFFVTGLSPNCDHRIDMTNMDLADSSIEASFSAFALEHVPDYKMFISESFRTLRPGGRILLVVPFIYCFHGAPNDYVRFSKSYLTQLFSNWNVLATTEIGNRAAIVAEMCNEKPWMGFKKNNIRKFALKLVATAATIFYIINPSRCRAFPSAILILAEKPLE